MAERHCQKNVVRFFRSRKTFILLIKLNQILLYVSHYDFCFSISKFNWNHLVANSPGTVKKWMDYQMFNIFKLFISVVIIKCYYAGYHSVCVHHIFSETMSCTDYPIRAYNWTTANGITDDWDKAFLKRYRPRCVTFRGVAATDDLETGLFKCCG